MIIFCVFYGFVLVSAAAVRRNPLARQATLKILQHVASKWLYGARDRGGGRKERDTAASRRNAAA